jgi:hypothetical protein
MVQGCPGPSRQLPLAQMLLPLQAGVLLVSTPLAMGRHSPSMPATAHDRH